MELLFSPLSDLLFKLNCSEDTARTETQTITKELTLASKLGLILFSIIFIYSGVLGFWGFGVLDADGFLRSTLRGMTRARRAAGKNVDAAYAIKQTADGRLLLVDTVTDQRVDLWAFGPTNAAAFSRYLQTQVSADAGDDSAKDLPVDDSALTAVALTNQETAQ